MIIHLESTLRSASDDTRHAARLDVGEVRGRAGRERHRRWERTLAAVVAASLLVTAAWWASVHLTTAPPPVPPASPTSVRDPNPATLPSHPDGRYVDPGPFDAAVVFARCAILPEEVLEVRFPAGGTASTFSRSCDLGHDKAPQQVMPTWPMDDATITDVCSATAGYDLSAFTLIGRESSDVGGRSEIAVFESTNEFVAVCRLVEAQEPNRVSIINRLWFDIDPWTQTLQVFFQDVSGKRYLRVRGAVAVTDATSGHLNTAVTRMTFSLADGSMPIALDIHDGWVVADRAVQVPLTMTSDDLANCSWSIAELGVYPCT